MAGPAALYIIDRMITLSRRRVFLPVVSAELLPSNVFKLVIQRPPDFEYRSGQYLRIACPALGDKVFHAFTISSPPQAPNISLHIRAVGPWTNRMKDAVSRALHLPGPLPKVEYTYPIFPQYIVFLSVAKRSRSKYGRLNPRPRHQLSIFQAPLIAAVGTDHRQGGKDTVNPQRRHRSA